MMKIEAKHGTPCVINTEGNVVIEPKVAVDTLYYPSHGYCQVVIDGKYGYIDATGELVIPCKYKKAYPFSENGLAFVVRDNGLGGYIDKNDRFVIHPIYDSGSTFKFGFAAVSRNGAYTFIYENGNKAIDHTFKYATGFSSCGLAKTQLLDGRYGLMDTKSRPVLTLKNGCDLHAFKDDTTCTTFSKNGKEALINQQGEIITKFQFEKVIVSPNSNLHPFLRNGLWGYIDQEGNEVIANIYQEVSEFTEFGYASVKAYHPLAENNLASFYINERDEIIDERIIQLIDQLLHRDYADVSRFKKGLALAVKKQPTSLPKKGTQRKTIVHEVKTVEKKLFDVHITFNNMGKRTIYDYLHGIIQKGVRVYEIQDNYVQLLWPLHHWQSAEMIDTALEEILHDGKVGNYEYEKIHYELNR